MAKTNVKTRRPVPTTHEGAKTTYAPNKLEALKRSALSCMLWEDTFYEDGVSITQRISNLVPEVAPADVAKLTIDARSKYKLRHLPLFLSREMVKHKSHKGYVKDVLANVIQRPDELAEFLSIYWKDGKVPIANQVKKGLASAFGKFNEYSLAKYNRDNDIKLRDVMFLCHPTPENEEQDRLWKKLIGNYCKNCWKPNYAHKSYKDTPKTYNGPLDGCKKYEEAKLETPDTWEVALSSGANKKESWTRLLEENKLGSLALLRNLRNMQEVGVRESLIKNGIKKMKTERVLPYRFIAASRYAPSMEPELEEAMFKCIKDHDKIKGKTILLVDVSGSMSSKISAKSDLSRFDAANGLAMLAREICEDVSIYTFSSSVCKVPSRRGFALRDAIMGSQPHSCTYLANAIENINKNEDYDRLIVFTDEQSHDGIAACKGKGYIMNVSCYQNGVGYGKNYTHISGFSETSLDWLIEYESEGF